MLADVTADNIAVLTATVGQDVLDEIIPKLITGDCVTVSNIMVAIRKLRLTVN